MALKMCLGFSYVITMHDRYHEAYMFYTWKSLFLIDNEIGVSQKITQTM